MDRSSPTSPLASSHLPAHPVGCRIIAVEDVHPCVRAMTVRPIGASGPLFRAGQAVMVQLPAGRPRALFPATAPEREDITLHVRHHPLGGAAADVGRTLRVGDVVWIEGAVGEAYLRRGTGGPIIIAAEIQALPAVLAIADAALIEQRDAQVFVFLEVVDEADVYQEAWLLDRQREHPHLSVAIALTSPRKPSRGPVMALASLIATEALLSRSVPCASAYIFGGRAVIGAVSRSLTRLGLPQDRLFSHVTDEPLVGVGSHVTGVR